jgi:predicted DNA-binding protein
MEYPKFSFRIAPEIATRLEEEASTRELTTSQLVREIVTTHYEGSAAAETRKGQSAASEADAERRFQQLIFEMGKTRLALLWIGLQTIPEETMKQILAAATLDARKYAALVAAGSDGPTAEPREQGDASGSRDRGPLDAFRLAVRETYLMKSISWYVASGHKSSATMPSSVSAVFRTADIAGSTELHRCLA